ncbi:MAG TPA: motility protein A [Candidatus Atribacteria bacterium]|nr:motility protein A [Candidatus Atribacteria bacterium]
MKKNIVPLIAAIGGFSLIVYAIGSDGGTFAMFWSLSSVIITVIGSFAALLISYPFKYIKTIPSLLKQIFNEPSSQRLEIVEMFSELARKARREGLLSLEDDIAAIEDPFLKKGLQMVVDGMEPKTISEIMELEIDAIDETKSKGESIFRSWGELAPAFGMLGTLIGLIIMLADLHDMDSIGIGMATALITTFYGSLFANLFFIPFANNLKAQKEDELYTREMMVEGILAIQSGVNPRVVEERLSAYLTPEERLQKTERLRQPQVVMENE